MNNNLAVSDSSSSRESTELSVLHQRPDDSDTDTPRQRSNYENTQRSSPDGNSYEASQLNSQYEDDNEVGDDEDSRTLLGNSSAERSDFDSSSTQNLSAWDYIKDMLTETAPTLFLTVIGLIFTGELLERVSRWSALAEIDELFILIPIVNNLKGNLEMNLSARLGTAANIGTLDARLTRKSVVSGNLILLQVQAAVVSSLAAVLAVIYGRIMPSRETMPQEMPQDSPPTDTTLSKGAKALLLRGIRVLLRGENPKRKFGFREFLMTLTTAISSASMSSIILGSFMCSLVLLCRRYRRNPDNIAPPVASCLGDLLTLTLLALSSTFLLYIPSPMPLIILLLLLVGAGLAARSTHKNDHVNQLLWSGWTPLLAAMLISSGTGLVLEKFVKKYEGFGMMAVVISGLPGSVGSVSISRLSTALHASTKSLKPPPRTHRPRSQSLSHFVSSVPPPAAHRALLTGATLFCIALPVQLTFLGCVYALGWMDLPWMFTGSFIGFFCIAVATSLVVAHYLTLLFWAYGYDPDNYCLPIHSALMDLIGQLMLVACYELVGKAGVDVDLRRRL